VDGFSWARAGWAGNQHYLVHSSGDLACTWDGMADSLCVGLHLGLLGYALWGTISPAFMAYLIL
jgi:alpha-D-xyloside xylohydrolase